MRRKGKRSYTKKVTKVVDNVNKDLFTKITDYNQERKKSPLYSNDNIPISYLIALNSDLVSLLNHIIYNGDWSLIDKTNNQKDTLNALLWLSKTENGEITSYIYVVESIIEIVSNYLIFSLLSMNDDKNKIAIEELKNNLMYIGNLKKDIMKQLSKQSLIKLNDTVVEFYHNLFVCYVNE